MGKKILKETCFFRYANGIYRKENIYKTLEDISKEYNLSIYEIIIYIRKYISEVYVDSYPFYTDRVKRIVNETLLKFSKLVTKDMSLPELIKKVKKYDYCYKCYKLSLIANKLDYPSYFSYLLVASKYGISVEDININTTIYIEEFANGSEIYDYKKSIKKRDYNEENNKDVLEFNLLVYKLIYDINDEGEILTILENTSHLTKLKNRILKYQDTSIKIMDKINYLVDLIDMVISNRKTNSIGKKDIQYRTYYKYLMKYLSFKGTIYDFYILKKDKLVNVSYNAFYNGLKNLVKDDELLKEKFNKHESIVKEYEISYLNSLFDTIIPLIKNGINGRSFTRFDYYMITNYPLDKLYYKIKDLDLLCFEDRKALFDFMSFDFNYDSVKKEVISYDYFIDWYNIKKKFGSVTRELSIEEKEAIYEYFMDNKIPFSISIIDGFVDEYSRGRLLLPSKKK